MPTSFPLKQNYASHCSNQEKYEGNENNQNKKLFFSTFLDFFHTSCFTSRNRITYPDEIVHRNLGTKSMARMSKLVRRLAIGNRDWRGVQHDFGGVHPDTSFCLLCEALLVEYSSKPAHCVETELRVVSGERGTHSHGEALRPSELCRARRGLTQHHDAPVGHPQRCTLQPTRQREA